jgi:transposase
MVAISRSILVIIFCLLSDRSARFCDLGPDFYDTQINRDRKIRSHIRQLQALGISPDDLAALMTKNPPAA